MNHVIIQAPQIPASLNVMPVGDSITNGNGDTAAINAGGYRQALGDWMNTIPRGCTMTMIGPNNNGFTNGQGAHDGVSGVEIAYHRAGGSGDLPALLTSGSYNADLLLLLIGTNDINNLRGVSTTLTQLAGLLSDVRTARPAIRVLLSTCIDGSDSTFSTNIQAYNAGMPAVVATENAAGGHVTLWDGFASMGAWNSTFWFDALHPKETGYLQYEAALQTQVYNELARF